MHETALPTDRHLSTSQLKQRSNPSKVIKVRAAFDNASRQETALVRKLGSCLRCRGRKERCKPDILNPNGECINCALTSLSVHQIPCIRTRIPQVSLYHTVTTENDTWTIRPEIFGTEPTELSSALHTGVKILELTQDYGKPLVVRVTEFIPVDGDQTSYIWSIDGAELELPMPCYAITNIPETKAAMETYMVQNLERYIDSFIDRNDSVVWATFQIAIHRARYRNSILLQKMLRLWIASRMVEKAWHICGRETLGLSHADTAGTPYEGKIPIPPVMDSQFDQIMVRFILNPLRAQVLKILDSRITPGKRSEWFETYLVVSLLLNSITLSTAHDHKFAKLHRHVAAGRGSRFEDYNLIESYFHGAQVLIAHFRVIINGHRPLQSGSPDQIMISHEDLDDKEVRYITMIHSQLDTAISTANFLRKHNRYENIMYWTPNLFSTSWDPSPIYIKELEEGEADLIGSY
ncbi:hypothetical protein EJ05DRAFT_394493 [Pseudovirgaria hyperparasitica]|uniref:Zn(2)-C6 fungal-type domain-containing protein n=1 Tax=Pseudovirgaria hyperparasitica TaxID=470096 RepID=A0A6A6W7L3_9PEZI|nr:uncharacterized protein EJ05DRAFT_394493 [Pseudovirgaria hyperparasitica]KAF2757567.1 hypothetical protein EJ05DRAFT_394493 [Pseudovirgaria hyperparasitica]